jgi:pimeloyl-ACP methyl ester carboxylesterase
MPYVENDGAKIYWEERGEGDPVLLIMGLGYTLAMWQRVWPALAAAYRVILFDNRGVGGSDAPPGPYSIPTMAGDAIAVMTAAGVERAHVYGISLGGIIAQELVLSHPERARSLILGCTSCVGTGAVAAEPEVLRVLLARATMTPEEGVRAMVPYIYDAATPRERVEEDLEIRRRTYPSAHGYLGQLQSLNTYESCSRVSQISLPTLVIHGESDQLIPPENGRLLAQRISGSKLVMLPAASHVFFTDQPEAANQAVLDFLNEQAK